MPLLLLSFTINNLTYTVLNNVLHNNREAILCIMAFVYLDPEVVHLQMEDIK